MDWPTLSGARSGSGSGSGSGYESKSGSVFYDKASGVWHHVINLFSNQ